jgi:hypothetical protein
MPWHLYIGIGAISPAGRDVKDGILVGEGASRRPQSRGLPICHDRGCREPQLLGGRHCGLLILDGFWGLDSELSANLAREAPYQSSIDTPHGVAHGFIEKMQGDGE